MLFKKIYLLIAANRSHLNLNEMKQSYRILLGVIGKPDTAYFMRLVEVENLGVTQSL